jgi:hypothetical protein
MKIKGFSGIYLILSTLLLIGIIGFAYFFTGFNTNLSLNNPGSSSQKVIDLAKKLYLEKKAQGMDFNNGPCLSDNIQTDWVVDIAHNPRQPIDNLPENQCTAFREGKAHHFVELDTNGNLIRIF